MATPPPWARAGSSYVTSVIPNPSDEGPSSTTLVRRVVPYEHSFAVFAKARWFGRPLVDIFAEEFKPTTRAEYVERVAAGCFSINGIRVTRGHPSVAAATTTTASRDAETGNEWTARVLVQEHDAIEHHVTRVEDPVPAVPPLTVVGADSQRGVIAIAKPPGMPVHPSGQYRHNTVVGLLKKIFGMGLSNGRVVAGRKTQRHPSGDDAPHSDEGFHFAALQASSSGCGAPVVVDRDGMVALAFSPSVPSEVVDSFRWLHSRQEDQQSPPPPLSCFAEMNDFHVVHRIDKSTSGVVLFALTPDASRSVFNLLAAKSTHAVATGDGGNGGGDDGIRKHYLARVSGRIAALVDSGEMHSLPTGVTRAEWPHGCDGNSRAIRVDRCIAPEDKTENRYKCVDSGASSEARAAITIIREVHYWPDAAQSLVECLPLTGRSHQLRLHLAHLGHPIVGDTKYISLRRDGGDVGRELIEPSSIQLHAWKYVLRGGGEDRPDTVFEAPPPLWAQTPQPL